MQDPDRQGRQAAWQRLETYLPPHVLLDFKESAKYFQLDKNLEIAINMALAVGAPLLLTGKPGTDKTQVAYYLDCYFNDILLSTYQVRETSTAEDMKYDFDALAYLRTAQRGLLKKKHLSVNTSCARKRCGRLTSARRLWCY